MRLWPDYIASRRSSLTTLLFCTLGAVIVTGLYSQRPPEPVQTPPHISPGEQAIVLQETDGYRTLLLYDPFSQGFRCALSLSSDPKQILYSPSICFSITPGHPLTIRYPDDSTDVSEVRHRQETEQPAEDVLPPVEVCITPRALTASQDSQYTREAFLQGWHVRWKEMERA